MSKLSINMKFWDDGQQNSTRLRNVKFCWGELKKLNNFLNKYIETSIDLYDFSPTKMISDATHIPYKLGVYKKSEKTNVIIQRKKNYEFFMMMDSDAFFCENDYENLLEVVKNIKNGDVVTFDLAKLDENLEEYFIDNEFHLEKANWSYAYSGDKENGPLNGYIGGLGGVYICDTKLLVNLGGFNETYEGWGGEDGDMVDRIWNSSIHHEFKPIRNFAPFHLPHFSDWNNKLYSQRFGNI